MDFRAPCADSHIAAVTKTPDYKLAHSVCTSYTRISEYYGVCLTRISRGKLVQHDSHYHEKKKTRRRSDRGISLFFLTRRIKKMIDQAPGKRMQVQRQSYSRWAIQKNKHFIMFSPSDVFRSSEKLGKTPTPVDPSPLCAFSRAPRPMHPNTVIFATSLLSDRRVCFLVFLVVFVSEFVVLCLLACEITFKYISHLEVLLSEPRYSIKMVQKYSLRTCPQSTCSLTDGRMDGWRINVH